MSPAPTPGDGPDPSGLLHLRTWLDPELDDGFSDWCDGHHLEQLAVPGFGRVRRFSLHRSTVAEPPRFLTLYDLDRLDVLRSPAYDEYRTRGQGLPEVLQGRLRAARSEGWLVAGVPAVPGLVDSGALLHLFVADGPELAPWFADAALPLVDATGATTARLFRTDGGAQVVLVELDALDPGLDPTTLPTPGEGALAGAEDGWGTYRLDYVATPDGRADAPHRSRRGPDRPPVGGS